MQRKYFYRVGAAKVYGSGRITQVGKVTAQNAYFGSDACESSKPDSKGRFSNLPLQRHANYVEREELQLQLKAQLHDILNEPSARSTIVVLQGLGGAGKTQLTLHYIQQHQDDYEGIFWLTLAGKNSVEREVVQLYRWLFQVQDIDITKTPPFEEALLRIKNWFQGRSGKWLWVIDNADNVEDPTDPDYTDLMVLIPQSPCVHVVITTRSTQTAGITPSKPVEIGPLSEGQALLLFWNLSKIRPENKTEEHIHKAQSIVKELGHLALAVTLAGTTIAESPRMSKDLNLYLTEYRNNKVILLGKVPLKIVAQYGESILTSWETSYNHVNRSSALASTLLGFLTLLNREDISLELFEIALNASELENEVTEEQPWRHLLATDGMSPTISKLESALEILRRYSLAQYDESLNLYTLHRLVQAWGFERLDNASKLEICRSVCRFLCAGAAHRKQEPRFQGRLAKHMMQSFHGTTSILSTEEDNAQLILHFVEKWQDFTDLLEDVGLINDCSEIKLYRLRALSALRGHDNLGTILAMGSLASTLAEQGKRTAAASMQAEVVEKLIRILGTDHSSTLVETSNLAIHLSKQGKLEDAVRMQRKVLEKRRQIHGEWHDDTITATHKLANMYQDQGHFKEAAQMYIEVLTYRLGTNGWEHPDTITAVSDFAFSLKNQPDLQIQIHRWVLERTNHIHGGEHPITLKAMTKLAGTLGDQDDPENVREAVKIQKDVLEKRNSTLGVDHPDTVLAKYNVAAGLARQGEYTEASSLLVAVVQEMQVVLGQEHPHIKLAKHALEFLTEKKPANASTEKTQPWRKFYYKEQKVLGTKLHND